MRNIVSAKVLPPSRLCIRQRHRFSRHPLLAVYVPYFVQLKISSCVLLQRLVGPELTRLVVVRGHQSMLDRREASLEAPAYLVSFTHVRVQ
jgi:hypothetical protein